MFKFLTFVIDKCFPERRTRREGKEDIHETIADLGIRLTHARHEIEELKKKGRGD